MAALFVANASASSAPPTIQVSADGDRVSVITAAAPLDAVVRTLAERTGIFVTIDDALAGERCSVAVHDVPVDAAFRAVAGRHDTFFRFGGEAGHGPALQAVWIYRRGSGRSLVPQAVEAGAAAELRQQLGAADPELRAAALEALVHRNDASRHEAVAAALRDDNDSVRFRALELALESDSELSGPALATLALSDRSPQVRLLALQSLERRPEARSVIESAIADPDSHIRIEAAGLLRRLDEAEAAITSNTTVKQRKKGLRP